MFYNNSVIVSTTFSLTNEYILLIMGLIFGESFGNGFTKALHHLRHFRHP